MQFNIFFMVLYAVFYILFGRNGATRYSSFTSSSDVDITTPIVNYFKRRNRRIKALNGAKTYLKPYEDIFGNLTLSNKFCSVSLMHKKKAIVCTSKTFNAQGQKMLLAAQNFNPVDVNEYWDMLCEIFSWNTNYQDVHKSLIAVSILTESAIQTDVSKRTEKQPEKKADDTPEVINVTLSRDILDLQEKVIDVNNCSEAELTALPGINIIMSKKIIKFREEERAFKSVDDFLLTMNIKPHFALQLKNMLCANKINTRKIRKAKNERILDL